PFLNLNLAFQKFFRDLKQGKVSYPKFKKKKDNFGSYYIGGDQAIIKDEKYLKVPNLGLVKMRENLRFNSKINSATISQKGDKYFASFSVEIPQDEFIKTHKIKENKGGILGIDMGLKSFVSLSNGLSINAPKPLNKLTRKLKRVSRQLSKKQHPKAKGDKTKKSNNYLKQNLKLRKIHTKIANMRNDFLHKLTSILANHYKYFCVESLNVQGMMKNHNLARSISDVSFFEFKRMLAYKSAYRGNEVIEADRFYPSSKTCHCCGYKKEFLTLSERIFQCENCGITIDRDYNASLNLKRYAINNIGLVQAEFTPEDLTALQSDLAINRIATSKVDTGIQQKSCL
ncbi:TPA: RNA-guided endonuclease InsQ/TnpB family protein, partial [Campylobacter jejuni]|nr:transposase [Campylobacter jejuni]EHF9393468.1 IS200/IS605 family element transposase accessory protein TnpB [Campylobacter jejuni]